MKHSDRVKEKPKTYSENDVNGLIKYNALKAVEHHYVLPHPSEENIVFGNDVKDMLDKYIDQFIKNPNTFIGDANDEFRELVKKKKLG